MRLLSVILLLACLFVQTGAFWLLGWQQQRSVKKEMKALIRSNSFGQQTETFVFDLVNGKPSAASFYWEEENEFYYQGKMYDVIRQKVSGNKIEITCINDKKEKELLEELSSLYQKTGSNAGKSNSNNPVSFNFIFIEPGLISLPAAPCTVTKNFASYQASLFITAKEILTPPPQA